MTIKAIEHQESTFEANIKRGIDAKILSINENTNKVTYHVKNEKSYKLSDPEEQVRASYYVELVCRLGQTSLTQQNIINYS